MALVREPPVPDFFGNFGTALHGFLRRSPWRRRSNLPPSHGRIVFSAKVFSELFAGFGGEQKADQRAGPSPISRKVTAVPAELPPSEASYFPMRMEMILSDLVVPWTISTVDLDARSRFEAFFLVNFCETVRVRFPNQLKPV